MAWDSYIIYEVWECVYGTRLAKKKWDTERAEESGQEYRELQSGFMPRKRTTDVTFALRMLMEKHRECQKELHCLCRFREGV